MMISYGGEVSSQTTFKMVYRPITKTIDNVLSSSALDFSGRSTNLDFSVDQTAVFDSLSNIQHFTDGQIVVLSNRSLQNIYIDSSLVITNKLIEIKPNSASIFIYLFSRNKFFDITNSGQIEEIQNAISSIDSDIQSIETLIASHYQEFDQRIAEEELAINTETVARTAADTSLQNQINNVLSNIDPSAIDSFVEVVAAFQAADANLNGAITNLSTTLSQEISSLDSKLDQEKLDRASGDAALDTRITALEDQVGDDLQTAITSLQASIASEESARVAADLDITTRIATLEEEIGDNLQQAISSLQAANTTLDTRITDLEEQVGDNLQTAISQIQLDISAEATTRASADIALQVNITNVQTNLSQETIDRIAADQTLQSNIGLEATRATAAEQFLSTQLQNEITRATAAEQQIANNLLTEKTRIDAILLSTDNLDSRLDIIEPKVSILESEMNLVESNIVSEIQRAILAEGELDGRLDSFEPKVSTLQTEMDAVESNLASEIVRATLAENALDSRLDILEPKVSTLETKMDSVQSGLAQEVLDRQAIDLALQGQINTEKFRTDAILLASDADKDSFAEIVQLINSIDTSNDSAFASYAVSNNAAVASLDSRLNIIEPKVTTLEVNLAQEVVSRENANIALQQQINLSNLNIDSLENLASTQEQEIINLKKRVLELEIDQDDFLFKREKIAIQLQQDLTYVDLEYKVIPNSIVASIDRLMIYLNDDFEVSVVNNVTRITWIGPLHSLGDEKMELGDILKVNYKISNSVFDSAPTPLILDDGLPFTLDNGDELIF